MRLYHPDLGTEYECPDDEGLLAVMAESGWKPAPDAPEAKPGLAPEPVKYAPVEPKPAAKRSSSKASTD
jgi:hypothetical protein